MTGCFGDFGLFFDFKEGFIIPLGSSLMMTCIQSLLFNVTLALRQIHPLQVLSFSSQKVCPKGQKKGFSGVLHFQMHTSSIARCFTRPITLRTSWNPALPLVLSFLSDLYLFLLILVAILKSCPVVAIPVWVLLLLTSHHKFTVKVWAPGWQAVLLMSTLVSVLWGTSLNQVLRM